MVASDNFRRHFYSWCYTCTKRKLVPAKAYFCMTVSEILRPGFCMILLSMKRTSQNYSMFEFYSKRMKGWLGMEKGAPNT